MIDAVRHRGRHYFSLIWHITWEGIRSYPRDIAILILLGVLGLLSIAGSIGGIVTYVHLAEAERTITWNSWTFTADGSLSTITILAVAAGFLGMVAGALLYGFQRTLERITRRHFRACIERVLASAALPHGAAWCDDLGIAPQAALSRLTSAAARFTAFTLRESLRLIIPLATCIAAAAVLLTTEPIFSLIILVLLAAYLFPTYLLNIQAFRYQRDYFERKAQSRLTLIRSLRRTLNEGPPEKPEGQWPGALLDGSNFESVMDAYFGRILADRRTQWLNMSLLVVSVCLIFAYFGYLIQQGERGWSELLLYLAALQFAIGSLRPISSTFIKYSRYHSECDFYHRFLRSCERGRALLNRPPAETIHWPITLAGKDLNGHTHRISVEKGSLIVALMPAASGRADLELILWRLRPFVGDDAALRWIRSASYLSRMDTKSPSPSEAAADGEPVDAPANVPKNLTGRDRRFAQAAAQILAGRPVAVVDHRELAGIDESAIACGLGDTGTEILILASPNSSGLADCLAAINRPPAAAVVLDGNRSVISVSDWVWALSNLTRIDERIDATGNNAAGDDDDDAVDED